MKSFGSSKFGLSVQSSGKGAAKRSIDPELIVTPTSGQIKINDATSRMLHVASRENVVLLGNRRELEDERDANPEEFATFLETTKDELVAEGEMEADHEITIDDVTMWGIAKGWQLFSKNGTAVMVADRLTKVEKEALVKAGDIDENGKANVPNTQSLAGFRVAANGAQTGIGHIMTGNDTANYPLMGGNGKENIVFSISRTPEILPVDNGCESVDVKVYMLDYSRREGKLRNADKEEAAVVNQDQEPAIDAGSGEVATDLAE